jgi:hypothetical protein
MLFLTGGYRDRQAGWGGRGNVTLGSAQIISRVTSEIETIVLYVARGEDVCTVCNVSTLHVGRL